MAGWIHVSLRIIYVIVRGLRDTTTSRSEDGYGFLFLEKHLVIGAVMLSLFCLCELTIYSTTQAYCAANTR